tara:strand:- start:42 stop:653 length:612 start_codon:yes stop_codon:yes gene_type:complete
MKKVIQLILLLILILFSIIFYKNFFQTNNQSNKEIEKEKNQVLINEKNNLIKNLKYEVKFDNNTQYTIYAELSELSYEDEIEIVNNEEVKKETEFVKMQKVTGILIDASNIPLIIKSNKANYNNSSYNTNFIGNVEIEYINNIIKSNKLDINFTENIVTIYDNVVYEGPNGLVNTDNVTIDLESKNVKIFMNEPKNKVEIISK